MGIRITILLTIVFLFVIGSTNIASASLLGTDFISFDSSISKTEKKRLNRHLNSGPKLLKNYLKEINSPLTITTMKDQESSLATLRSYGLDDIYTTTYEVVYSSNHVHSNFVFWHEMAHVINYSGVSNKDLNAFMKSLKKHKRWKKCYSIRDMEGKKTCVSKREIFADQVGYFASGEKGKYPISGYGIPRLASQKQLERLLKKHVKIIEPSQRPYTSSSSK